MTFHAPPPWSYFVPPEAFQHRVELNDDLCMVDERLFFARCHLVIPFTDADGAFVWSVWSSLSPESFARMNDNWTNPERAHTPPYFGWLMSDLPGYPKTLQLPLRVQERAPGTVPLATVTDDAHPLAHQQQNGLSLQAARSMERAILSTTSQH